MMAEGAESLRGEKAGCYPLESFPSPLVVMINEQH
jgi:hypothetical protein